VRVNKAKNKQLLVMSLHCKRHVPPHRLAVAFQTHGIVLPVRELTQLPCSQSVRPIRSKHLRLRGAVVVVVGVVVVLSELLLMLVVIVDDEELPSVESEVENEEAVDDEGVKIDVGAAVAVDADDDDEDDVVEREVVVLGHEKELRKPSEQPLLRVEQTLVVAPKPVASHQVHVRFAMHKSHGKSAHVRTLVDVGVAEIVVVVVVNSAAAVDSRQKHWHGDSEVVVVVVVDDRPGDDSHSDNVVRAAHVDVDCVRAGVAKNVARRQQTKKNIVCLDVANDE
jgi:hypothetical protein